MYDFNGAMMQVFDCSEKGFTSATFNSTGEIVVLGCYNGFHTFQSSGVDVLEDLGWHEVKNLHTVAAVSWKPDGSQVAVGSLCGNVDLYDAYMKRQRYGDKFEFIFVSKSQVILTHISPHTRMLLQSQFGWEILKINIFSDQFLVAYTEDTLMLGNLENFKLSEIMWSGSGHEKFLVDNPAVCVIYDRGEVSLVEYGSHDILTSVQTDHFQEALISIRLDGTFSSARCVTECNNRLAYLVDLQTMQVKDVISAAIVDTIHHNSEIVWLQLNPRATHLLFCDKRRQLFLFELGKQEYVTLLAICNFVQWVPDTDIVIAQSYSTLFIWYSIQNIHHATRFSLKGDLEGVRRIEGRTEVLVYEGFNTVAYELDKVLIDVGLALEKLELDQALSALVTLELTTETRFMWEKLGDKSLEQNKLLCAEESFASSGHVCRAEYLHKVNKQLRSLLNDTGQDVKGQYHMQVQLALFCRNWKHAEKILLEHGEFEDAIRIHVENLRWKEALLISYLQNTANCEALRSAYLDWLLGTGQIQEAGNEKALAGDVLGAVKILASGYVLGLAADYAMKVVGDLGEVQRGSWKKDLGMLLDTIINALANNGMLEKLGQLMENMGNFEKAQEAYCKGHSYRLAVELARKWNMGDLAKLKEEWGDWMVSKNQMEAAINHYIEAGCFLKAIEAAITSHQWSKGAHIASQQEEEVRKPIYVRVARHFEKTKQFVEAERLFVEAKVPGEAVIMYLKTKKWDAAQKVCSHYLSMDEAHHIYFHQAKEYEASRRFKDAERLYLEARQPDCAINMYKAEGMFDNVIQLVSKFKKDGLNETHLYLAQELERKGMLRDAEHHFLEVHDWRSVVKMYSAAVMWEDALRVAKAWGGASATKQVAYAWAIALDGENVRESLAKLGLADQAIEHAVDIGAFSKALEFCTAASADKLQEAKKPELAVEMYKANNRWEDAIRVARKSLPTRVSEIQLEFASFAQSKIGGTDALESVLARAKAAEARQNFQEAIDLYLIVDLRSLPDMEKLQKVWRKAIELAKEHAKDRLLQITQAVAEQLVRAGQHPEAALLHLEFDNYKEAADVYITGGFWDDARKMAESTGQEKLLQHIETLYRQHLLKAGDAGSLAGIGNVREALEIYSSKEDWEKVHELSTTLGPDVQKEFSARHATYCLRNSKVFDAVSVLSHYGLPNTLEGLEVCGWITSQVLYNCSDTQVAEVAIQDFRAFLYNRIQSVKCSISTDSQPDAQNLRPEGARLSGLEELEAMLVPVTYMMLCVSCKRKGLKTQTAKLSISLLRFVESLPADKAFYEAGIACKAVDWKDKAFFFLNQYLDIAEAIDDEESSITVDHQTFDKSDIPQTFTIPKSHFVDAEKQEEVQDWVIQFSVNQQEERSSMTRECRSCGSLIYEASLYCFNCRAQSKACCVTGYPLDEDAQIECPSCNMVANRGDWTTFVEVFQKCPWCTAPVQASH